MSHIFKLQTKKLGIFELLAMGFDLYLFKIKIFFAFFLLFLPFLILFVSLSRYSNGNPNLLLGIMSFLSFLLYMFAIVPLYSAILAILTESVILQDNIQLKSVFERILSRILPLFSLWIRFLVRFSLLFLLLIIPGIIYGINNGFCIQALVLRDQQGKSAFKYSQSLVKGNWWKIFSFSLVITLIVFGLMEIFTKTLSIVIPNSPILVDNISNFLSQLIILGASIGGNLLFLNLEFQKK